MTRVDDMIIEIHFELSPQFARGSEARTNIIAFNQRLCDHRQSVRAFFVAS